MFIEDIEGAITNGSASDLEERLRAVRRGPYGAFMLWHEKGGPSLWIATNENIAYLHFFPAGARHAGYQPTGMTPIDCPALVHFLQVGGAEADSFDLPSSTLVPIEAAYIAAHEFFGAPALPQSLRWLQL